MNMPQRSAESAMTRFVKLLPAILAFPLCAQAAEPQVFKCKDAAGRITYAGRECSELGLSSAGEIKDRTNVTPRTPPLQDSHLRAAHHILRCRTASGQGCERPRPRAAKGAPALDAPRRLEDLAILLHGEDRQRHGRTLQ